MEVLEKVFLFVDMNKLIACIDDHSACKVSEIDPALAAPSKDQKMQLNLSELLLETPEKIAPPKFELQTINAAETFDLTVED